jgi:nucleoside phosphorylase
MEGFGLYLTAHSLEKQALWIKAVCDYADRSKGDDYHKSCSYASATFLYQMLREKF